MPEPGSRGGTAGQRLVMLAALAVLLVLQGGPVTTVAAPLGPAVEEVRAQAGDGTTSWLAPAVMAAAGAALLLVVGYRLGRRRERKARAAMASGLERTNRSLEDRLEQRSADLEAANRELEAFAYAVSHDLRAPVRTIDGFASLLRDHVDANLDDEGRHYLDRIQTGVESMTSRLDSLLALSRATRGTLRRDRVNLTGLAEEAARRLAERDPHRTVSVRIAPGLSGSGDGRLLRTVLEQALDNAWKFTGRKENAMIEVGSEPRDGETVFFVRDDGAGFDMAYADKLFKPFRRLHGVDEFPGSGVGLAIIYNIVRRHGGQIWMDASPGAGATLYFTLPERRPAA